MKKGLLLVCLVAMFMHPLRAQLDTVRWGDARYDWSASLDVHTHDVSDYYSYHYWSYRGDSIPPEDEFGGWTGANSQYQYKQNLKTSKPNNPITLNLQSLAPGTYNLQATAPEGTARKAFVKE